MSNDLGIDRSGNGNNWTVNNMAFADQVVDSPTNNFATLNPLDWYGVSNRDRLKFKEGNLWTYNTDTAHNRTPATIGVSSGKFYWEVLMWSSTNYFWQDQEAAVVALTGFNNAPNNGDANEPGRFENNGATYHSSGTLYANDTGGTSSWGSSYTKGDIISIALDMDNGKVWFAKNGTWQASGNPATGANPAHSGMLTHADTYTAMAYLAYSDSTEVFNFGQDSSFAGIKTAQGNQDGNDIGDFYYTPPAGFLALCTKNLPDVTVTPSEHFNTVLYTGTGSSNTQNADGITSGVDFLWTKCRSHAKQHILVDDVRGGNNNLMSDSTEAENSNANRSITLADSSFTLNSNSGHLNESSKTYVSWLWKANGSGSSNTNGSINTTATSANVDAGFSVSTWTGNATSGASIGHGLSKAPELIINKQRSGTSNWYVYHKDLGATKNLELEVTGAANTTSNIWNDQAPTSTVSYRGNNGSVNGNNETYVTYCWHGVDGYSKFGSYETNGASGDNPGAFVYTGFKPAFIILKAVDYSNGYTSWVMFDNKRNGYNRDNEYLFADTNEAEMSTYIIHLYANGFQVYDDYHAMNNTGTYVYMAFAETPFKYSNAR